MGQIIIHVVPGASALALEFIPFPPSGKSSMPNAPNLKVRLPVRPEKGAANKALLRLLSDLSGHPVQIVRGNKDRNKTVAFAASGEEFLTALKEGWLKSQAGR